MSIRSQVDVESEETWTPRFFHPASIAKSLNRIATDVVRGADSEFTTFWFQSSDAECDFVIWKDDQARVIKQQICLFGQIVEWTPIHGVRTGILSGTDTPDDILNTADSEESREELKNDLASEVILFDEEISLPLIQQAIDVIMQIDSLPLPSREELRYQLARSPRMHKSALARALKQWKVSDAQLTSPSRSESIPKNWKTLVGQLAKWFSKR